MKKKILFLSILCLLFVTLSYTYSSFKNTIVANITANVKNWVFKVSVNNGTIKDGGYNLHLSGTSGSFNVNINTTGSKSGADYTIELIGDSSIKFYTDSSYTKLINNNIYSGSINSNTSSSVTIYYKSDTAINSDILIKTKGTIMEIATMKNGYSADYSANGGTEFWSDNYKPYVRTITFGNDLGNLPSTCNEENLCWDISESATQKKKVYGYLVDTGLKDKTDNSQPLYNLYIVSNYEIFAPSNCENIFSFYESGGFGTISNLTKINFNNNFNTTKVTNMKSMFESCLSLIDLDLSSFNISNVTNMYNMFYYCSSLTSLDLSSFNTAKVTNMNYIFGGCKSLTSLDLSSFNTAKVTNVRSMFSGCSSLTSLDLSGFNTSNVKDMGMMFSNCTSLTSLDLSSFNTLNVINMEYMFRECSSLSSLDLSSFNTANTTNMSWMFSDCTSLTSLDLSGFNTANVTDMGEMFFCCKSLMNLDLSSFNTAKVTEMGGMFEWCSSLTSLDLSIFNTANVTDMDLMFYYCKSLTSLDLSSFNTANVTSMSRMFDECSSLTSLDLSGFNTSKVTDMMYMFFNCSSLTTTINIMNADVTNYSDMFYKAAIDASAKITVNYFADTSTLVDKMIATKSSNSNVIKGNIIPEHSITITGIDDIKYESLNRAKGTKVTLISISGNNYVTSFKMNGTTINGNEFIMNDNDVTISDIVTIPCKTIESAHNPYPNSQDNVIIGELTFEGAKSLTVILDYQTQDTYWDYFLIYDSSSSTTGINNNKKYAGTTRTKETITINSNYIKITFTSDRSDNTYYGLKAIIIPNY